MQSQSQQQYSTPMHTQRQPLLNLYQETARCLSSKTIHVHNRSSCRVPVISQACNKLLHKYYGNVVMNTIPYLIPAENVAETTDGTHFLKPKSLNIFNQDMTVIVLMDICRIASH